MHNSIYYISALNYDTEVHIIYYTSVLKACMQITQVTLKDIQTEAVKEIISTKNQ